VFNIGPLELIVLAFVGIVVLGPDRLPGLAKDAARLIRALREMATGARTQLRDELGPEFADMDLRSLHPRTIIQRTLLGDDVDLNSLNPRTAIQRMLQGEEPVGSPLPTASAATDAAAAPPETQPLGRSEAAPFDTDAT
jgi:sec-independent protein translocase protein TatB